MRLHKKLLVAPILPWGIPKASVSVPANAKMTWTSFEAIILSYISYGTQNGVSDLSLHLDRESALFWGLDCHRKAYNVTANIRFVLYLRRLRYHHAPFLGHQKPKGLYFSVFSNIWYLTGRTVSKSLQSPPRPPWWSSSSPLTSLILLLHCPHSKPTSRYGAVSPVCGICPT